MSGDEAERERVLFMGFCSIAGAIEYLSKEMWLNNVPVVNFEAMAEDRPTYFRGEPRISIAFITQLDIFNHGCCI